MRWSWTRGRSQAMRTYLDAATSVLVAVGLIVGSAEGDEFDGGGAGAWFVHAPTTRKTSESNAPGRVTGWPAWSSDMRRGDPRPGSVSDGRLSPGASAPERSPRPSAGPGGRRRGRPAIPRPPW